MKKETQVIASVEWMVIFGLQFLYIFYDEWQTI